MEKKPTIIQTLLITVLAINLMLTGILFARNQISMPEAAPTMGKPVGTTRTEYQMELENVTREGKWQVQHYRKIQLFYDAKGQVVKKEPTDEQTHLRYWTG
ncbi:hypothetical protein GXN76_07725 [Kroppenstedtia pulmonis]|uniref:Uncharacterized protein n=1 Tax=Kroppenstedtia pulmonis TaxID=1380685 RepID=A0A7D4C6E2_9BACL|nr:hypothetical protein [Kroppenstedtia pulmonis]QKG84376.1 hypothetical protein GXN76_07725 [Kroppenstedtia pulmonis]